MARPPHRLPAALLAGLLAIGPSGGFAAAPAVPAAPGAALPLTSDVDSIAAVVNGVVISRDDVANRERLFAVSAGMNMTPEMQLRLAPQVTRSLIDEKLQLQEIQRRKIVVTDAEIAAAINDIEARNGLRPGALRANLQAKGVSPRTLIDQIRVQIGWIRVLHDQLGNKGQVSDAEVADRLAQLKALTGQTEYRVAEIFVPIDAPGQEAEAQKFADTAIAQLRAGAPFGIMAAQFSASQTALQGGELGWVRTDRLDPSVAALVTQMPVGAISNPVRVPGGFVIVTVHAKREIGRDMATVISVRQAFFPFATNLDPAHPTEQQQAVLARSQALSHDAKTCADVEAAAKAMNSPRPPDPGELRLEAISSAPMRQILSNLPVGRASAPLVAPDGIMVVMICNKEQRNVAEATREEIVAQIQQERVELAARQLLSELRRRGVIERRNS